MVTQTFAPALPDEQRERLVDSFSRKVLADPYIEIFQKIAKDELEDLIRSILISLNRHLEGDRAAFDRCFEFVGNTCFQLSVPLLETAYCLFLLRDWVVELLPCEQEADTGQEGHRAARFFDRLVLELLRRY